MMQRSRYVIWDLPITISIYLYMYFCLFLLAVWFFYTERWNLGIKPYRPIRALKNIVFNRYHDETEVRLLVLFYAILFFTMLSVVSCPVCLFTPHADGSRESIALIRSVILSVCPHDKTKTAETKIITLGTAIFDHDTIPHPPMNIRSKVNVTVRVRRSSGRR